MANLDSLAVDRAQAVESLAASGSLSPVLPSTGSETSLVQVVDSSNTVVSATSNIDGQEPILSVPPTDPVRTFLSVDHLSAGDGPFRILADSFQYNGRTGWVYVATSTDQVDDAVSSLAALFAVGLPIVLVVVTWALWRAVGQVIGPVDAIRRRAAVIGGEDLSQRVPVPTSADEIASLAVTMNEMLSRLEEAAIRQRQFVGDASHELRSPLAALRVQVDVALAHPEDPGSAHVLESVQLQIERMSTLIDDLLFLARRSEDAPLTNVGVVDLDDLVLGEVHRLRDRGGPDIVLQGLRAARVTGSARDLQRLLRNLGDNALQHATSDVTIRLRTDHDTAEITVMDDGAGIKPEDRLRVFERFTRLDDARSRQTHGGGAGVGLSIAAQIVRDHHGTIAAMARPDGHEGAVFLVMLPLAPQNRTQNGLTSFSGGR
ncbi:sensor histidine kinase [Cryobacterium zhongshanensis]|uniref:histidine kinase n=1 Tax=Cryobacterium zhongshanensis TaxID=2928153 RepID=A0AA41QYS3_9MICO|nr:HAMP domain-containing sensor histidine kinase [Cryobacterium zhongshanensis]MCI4660060.1 HAMP domain-containing histidine kinase [Cryobacterium zhongshanensis]